MNRVPFNSRNAKMFVKQKLSEVTGRRRRRARAEFEKARRSLFLMQCDLKMMQFFLVVCFLLLCTSSYLETNVDCVWQLQ